MDDTKQPAPVEPAEWQKRMQQEAIGFSLAVQNAFDEWMRRTLKAMPVDSPQTRMFQLDTFLDALAGTSVVLVGKYVNAELTSEEAFVEMVRDKFKLYRQAQIMSPNTKGKPRLIQ